MKKLLIPVLTLLTLTGCGPSTHIVNSWRDPSVTVNTNELHKFVVAALLKNEAVRRRTEDKMAALNLNKAIQSYLVFGNAEPRQGDATYIDRLKNGGYDGIVILRLVKVDKDQRYVPGTYPAYYGSWYGYYGVAWGGYYDPGYYTTDKTYYVEVNVYSVPKDKLVWSGITSTINPSNGDELFDGVINAVEYRMREEGFLVTPKKKK